MAQYHSLFEDALLSKPLVRDILRLQYHTGTNCLKASGLHHHSFLDCLSATSYAAFMQHFCCPLSPCWSLAPTPLLSFNMLSETSHPPPEASSPACSRDTAAQNPSLVRLQCLLLALYLQNTFSSSGRHVPMQSVMAAASRKSIDCLQVAEYT